MRDEVDGAVFTTLTGIFGGFVIKFLLRKQMRDGVGAYKEDVELMNLTYENACWNAALPYGFDKARKFPLPSCLRSEDFIRRYKYCRWSWSKDTRRSLDAVVKYLTKLEETKESLLSGDLDEREFMLSYRKLMRLWAYCAGQMETIGNLGTSNSSLSTSLFIPAKLVKYKLQTDPTKARDNYIKRNGIKLKVSPIL